MKGIFKPIRFSVLIISIFILSFIFIRHVYAQNPSRETFNKALYDYSLKYEEYNSAHNEYVLTRSQYLKFKTLTSKTNAQAATSKMLRVRDEVVVYYLNAIKARLNDTSIEISADKKNNLYLKIDSEIAWFNDHKGNISENDSLEALVSKSNDASTRFKGLGLTIYESLYSISDGRMLKYRIRFNDFFLNLTDLVGRIRTEERAEFSLSNEKLTTIDRWIIETRDRLGKSEEEQSKAEEQGTHFGEKTDNKAVYNQTIDSLTKTSSYLKEAIGYTKEIIREIKVAE
jgi:hypothetical protein